MDSSNFTEVNVLRAKYAHLIDDGKKIEMFTSMPDWQWYVNSVLQPTIDEYIARILEGKAVSDREDWMLRGMVNGLKMVIESTTTFKSNALKAKESAEKLEQQVKDSADE